MFEFEIVQELVPNAEILEIIKDNAFTIKNSKNIDNKEQMF